MQVRKVLTQRSERRYAERRATGKKNGDTPTGLTSTFWKYKDEYASYGKYGSIDLTGLGGLTGEFEEAQKNGRDGILIHAGHTVGNKGKLFDDRGMLMSTLGCVRVYNADMRRLVNRYNTLQQAGKTIKCYVEDVSSAKMDEVFKTYGIERDPKDTPRETRSSTQ